MESSSAVRRGKLILLSLDRHLVKRVNTKGNAEGIKGERQNIRIIKKSQFKKSDTFDGVIEYLFGL